MKPHPQTHIYVAGPMSGYAEFNHPAFFEAERDLHAQGYWSVHNPARADGGSTHKPWSFYMRKAVRALADADAIVCLNGWQDSKGACVEVQLALDLHIPVYRLSDWTRILTITNMKTE